MITIEEGQQYLLDGKIQIRVIKAVTRSRTTFSIELPEKKIEIVGKERLQPLTVSKSD